MPRVELPMGSIHYEEAGPASGRPVVFVHGVLVDGAVWGKVPALVSERGLRCIAPTWPMGAHDQAMRPGTDLSPSGMAAIVAAFLDALDLRDVVLVGNDSGGAISQVVAAEHPGRLGALVLTNCDTLEHFPPLPLKFLPPLARVPAALRVAVSPYRFGPFRRSPLGFGLLTHTGFDHLASRWIARLTGDRAVFEDARRFIAGMSKQATLAAADRLKTLGKPIVLAWGEDDIVFTPGQGKRFAETVGARLEWVPRGRTFPMLDEPGRVAEIVAEVASAAERAPAEAVA